MGSVKSGVGGYLLIMKASQTWFPQVGCSYALSHEGESGMGTF